MLPAALILWHAGSDVMGCRRPTGGVFTYVSSDRVTLRAFPVATPRGRSSSSHEGEPLLFLPYITHFLGGGGGGGGGGVKRFVTALGFPQYLLLQ